MRVNYLDFVNAGRCSTPAENAIRQRAAKILVGYRRRLARAGIPYPPRASGESPMLDYRRLRLVTKTLDELEALRAALKD